MKAQPRLTHDDQERHLPARIRKPGGSRDEADLTPHRLQHQHGIGWRGASVLLVGGLNGEGPVAGHAPIARCVINELELAIPNVVVDRLGHTRGHQIQPSLVGQLCYLVSGIHRVVAADVEKGTNVVSLEDLDGALEVLFLACPQLVPASADGPGSRRGAQQSDLLRILSREVQQFLLQHPFDAVIASIDGAKVVRQRPAGFDNASQRVIDYWGRSA